MTHLHLSDVIGRLYAVVRELQQMYPGRPFTPDGHLVGSIGECLVAERYGLVLKDPSNEGFDALTVEGKQVEIKTTQADKVAFRRHQHEHCIVVRLLENGGIEEHYNGPGHHIWALIKDKKPTSNGQHQVSLYRLRKLQEMVSAEDRITESI